MKTLLSLVGSQVGWLRVNKPVVNHNANYECAAWWQEETSALGVFPLYLREDYYTKGKFFATATLPAKVTDCNFASLFCGNPIGKYDKPADVGRDALIVYRVELPALVATTGGHNPENLPAVEYTVIWEHVPAMIAHYKAKSAEWLAVANKALTESLDTDTTGARNSFSWSSLAAYAEWSGECAKSAVEMSRHLGYMTEKHDSWRELAAKNFHWVPVQA